MITINHGDSWNEILRENPMVSLSDLEWDGELMWYVNHDGDHDHFLRASWELGYDGQDLNWDGAGATTDDVEYATGMVEAGFEVDVL